MNPLGTGSVVDAVFGGWWTTRLIWRPRRPSYR